LKKILFDVIRKIQGGRYWEGGLGEGTSFLLWKIWTQLSPILRENIYQIFSNFGRKYISNFLQFWKKISFKSSPILEEDIYKFFFDFE
jgi:hypothetical protein